MSYLFPIYTDTEPAQWPGQKKGKKKQSNGLPAPGAAVLRSNQTPETARNKVKTSII
jgi:hypothetical protein